VVKCYSVETEDTELLFHTGRGAYVIIDRSKEEHEGEILEIGRADNLDEAVVALIDREIREILDIYDVCPQYLEEYIRKETVLIEITPFEIYDPPEVS